MYAQNASKLTNEMHQGEKKTERYFSGSTFRAQGVKMYFFPFYFIQVTELLMNQNKIY